MLKQLSDALKDYTLEGGPEAKVEVRNSASARWNLAEAGANATTRLKVAAEISEMILAGEVSTIVLEGLDVLPAHVKKINIEVDPNDPDPLTTTKGILREAGFSGTQELDDKYHPYSAITIQYKTKGEPQVEQTKTVPVLIHEQWEEVLQHATLDVSLQGGTIENISFRPMYPRGLTPEIAHIDDCGFLPKE